MRGCDRRSASLNSGKGFCMSCGAPLNSGEGFCMSCGAPQPSISDDGGQHDASAWDLRDSQRDSVEPTPASPGFFRRLFRRWEKAAAENPAPPRTLPSDAQGSVCPRCGAVRNNPADRFCLFCGFCFSMHNDSQAEEDETTVFDDGLADGDESTTILDEEPYCYFVRDATGERIVVNPPALVGKGSAVSCRIVGNNGISRVHAEIFVKQGVLMIKDRGSTNGTFVNGERLGPNRELRLQDGDVVLLADETFTFHVEGV